MSPYEIAFLTFFAFMLGVAAGAWLIVLVGRRSPSERDLNR